MSSVMLFLEIERIKNKIDSEMNMAIWPKFFPLLADPDGHINLSLSEFQQFLVTVAQMARTAQIENNAALASAARDNTMSTTMTSSTATPSPPRNILNLFGGGGVASSSRRKDAAVDSVNMATFRKNCQKLIKHYTLSNTSSSEFKVADIVSCMVYLAKSPKFKPLYSLLQLSMTEEYDCMPSYTADEMHHIVDLIKSLLDLPTSLIDFSSVKILKSTFNKAMNYPITRFARVMILPTTSLVSDKRCTIEELIVERGQEISKLEPQQYLDSSDGTKIPYCDDEQFINDLLKLIDDFSLHRMFYNAANSIFYTTMENYAVANCKFDVNDYNNIFRVMDNLREYEVQCGSGGILVNPKDKTDSLNIFLGNGIRASSSSSSSYNAKRKKYQN
ncbi:ORF64 [Spodoptera exigua multiple nucleopolyhedrovirus]|uniref:ORF64 n=1 Tax=Spodoptera exigua nuclear polyhedrosis virus (strain US) TaxID=31506 RepID=Q9J871_NPVSE|nr:ORF64 [Spodoptera exigua multiple nucleopolyhedrovirus]AAF33594.1 ORF64 [Spodoptera exigua multiple nucleopolyhedrovirus]UWK31585.1 p40 [Spodoptera exigua multiple nucleopolyhedrovirus]